MVECTLSITPCLRLNLQLHTIDLVRTCRMTALLRGNWQDFNWHDASRGPSAIAELLVWSSWRYALGRSVHAVVCWGWMKRCCTVGLSSCSNPAGMTPTWSQLSLHHRLTNRRMWRRARMWKWVALHTLLTWSSKDRELLSSHTETLYCSCNRSSNAGDCDVVDLWFRPLSSSGTSQWRSLRFCLDSDKVRWRPTAMDRLETVAECLVREWCIVEVSSAYWAWWTFLKGAMTLSIG